MGFGNLILFVWVKNLILLILFICVLFCIYGNMLKYLDKYYRVIFFFWELMKYMNGFIYFRVKCFLFMYVVNDSGKKMLYICCYVEMLMVVLICDDFN